MIRVSLEGWNGMGEGGEGRAEKGGGSESKSFGFRPLCYIILYYIALCCITLCHIALYHQEILFYSLYRPRLSSLLSIVK